MDDTAPGVLSASAMAESRLMVSFRAARGVRARAGGDPSTYSMIDTDDIHAVEIMDLDVWDAEAWPPPADLETRDLPRIER
jgi:hypothetical protein